MNKCMIDLETLGTRAGCTILSIGGVMFDEMLGRTGKEFYTVLSVASNKEAGLVEDPETLAWWSKQPAEARQVLSQAQGEAAVSVTAALQQLNAYLAEAGAATVTVWGNGSDFDNSILYAAYAATGVKQGWAFWNSRCFRTLKSLAPEVPPPARQGVHHNALDDARHQAVHAIRVLRHLKGL